MIEIKISYKKVGESRIKICSSEEYNYTFNEQNGYFARWGKTKDDDPEYSPYGCEILDIEISTICSKGCKFCYKTNTCKGNYMTFTTFKQIFKTFPDTLTQIAFGIGDIDGNPDLWKIMHYCRDNGIIPNITINGDRMTPELYDKLVNVCGAVAVSLYDYDECYRAVKELTDRGMTQVNIHCLLAEQTLDKCFQVLKDKIADPRLANLNAIVFLWLKPKGNRNTLTQVASEVKFGELVDFALDNNIAFGFDSCSAALFTNAIKTRPEYNRIKDMIEPCESTLFSYYINTEGVGFPCSFTEGTDYKGIDLKKIVNFDEVWYGDETKHFRDKVMNSKDCNDCRNCVAYKLGVGC